MVSKADVFRGRVGTENWNLLKYFFNLLAEAAVISPKSFKPFDFIYPPMRIMKLFWTKNQRTILDSISSKIAHLFHVSKFTAKEEMLPFMKIMLERKKTKSIFAYLDFEPNEIDFIKKMNKL